MQDELEDLRDCGIGGCKPKILQGLANIKVRFSIFSIFNMYIQYRDTLERGKNKCMNERRAGFVERDTRLSRLRIITRRLQLSPGCIHI